MDSTLGFSSSLAKPALNVAFQLSALHAGYGIVGLPCASGCLGFVLANAVPENDSANSVDLGVFADISGSMGGTRIAKINALLASLAPNGNLVFGTFHTLGKAYPRGSPPARVTAGGGTCFLSAMDLLHNCVRSFPTTFAGERKCVLVLLSDGETTPADYLAAAARLMNEDLLTRLSCYTAVHILLVGIGAESGVVDAFKNVMQPLRAASDTGLINAYFDFMAIDDGMASDEFVARFMSTTASLSQEASLDMCLHGEKVRARPVVCGGMQLYAIPVLVSAGAEAYTVNGIPLKMIPARDAESAAARLAQLLYTRSVLEELLQSIPLENAIATQRFQAALTNVMATVPSDAQIADEAEASAAAVRARLASSDVSAASGTSKTPAILKRAGQSVAIAKFIQDNALVALRGITEAFKDAGLDTSDSSLDGLFSGRDCLKALRTLLVEIRTLGRKMGGISHVLSKADALALLAETGRQRHAHERAAGVLVDGQNDVVLAQVALMDPESFETPAVSKEACVRTPAIPDAAVGVLFFSNCCVTACKTVVHNAAPDCISFSVLDPVTGVPVDAVYALAHKGVVEGIVSGMPRTSSVAPMPGDPLVTLALLQAMISVNVRLELNAKYTPLQILAAYYSFLRPLCEGSFLHTGASLQAAGNAFLAFLEICRLDSTHPLVPKHVQKVRIALHADRRTHNGSQTSKFKDDDCVRWSDLVQGFIARLRETPDAATSNTFSPNVATMLWAVAKYNAAEAALAIPDADAAATVSATPVGGAGSGGVDVDVDVFVNTLGDVDLMAYFILLQYVRNRLCVDGTAKAVRQILECMVAEQLLMGSDAVVAAEPDAGPPTTVTVFTIASGMLRAIQAVGRIPPLPLDVMEAGMDKPLGGFTQQLFEVCMQPMVKAMETMWNSICCHTGIAAPSSSPLALTPRLVREVLFRAMGALDRKAYSDAMSRPYLGAISSVLGPLLPILEKTVHDRIFADVVGQRPTLRNKYACVMNMLLSFRYRDGGSVGFPGTPGSQGGEFTWAMTTAEMFKFKGDMMTIGAFTGDERYRAQEYIDSVKHEEVLTLMQYIMINGGRAIKSKKRRGMYLSIF